MIVFIGADDSWLSTKLEKLLYVYDSENVVAVHTNVKTFGTHICKSAIEETAPSFRCQPSLVATPKYSITSSGMIVSQNVCPRFGLWKHEG